MIGVGGSGSGAVGQATRKLQPSALGRSAALLDDEITWHESTPGFEGDYHGREQVLALLGRVFQEIDVQMSRISIHDLLANDDHTVILHETTLTKNGRSFTGQYVDVYHLRNGKMSEHWHLAIDPKANEAFLAH